MRSGYIDARRDGYDPTIDASVCIVGAGAAGLTLAHRLGRVVPGVVLIESGGFEMEGATQGLYAGEQLGLPYFNMAACRLRYFGGTTNHWTGVCRTNDPIDYEGRPELNLPRWPVTHGELQPYVDSAARMLGIEPSFFDPGRFFAREGFSRNELIDRRTDLLRTKVFQISTNLRLGKVLRSSLAGLDNLRTFLNLNAVHLQLQPDGRSVAHLNCATLSGKKVKVTAKHYILACHAIENARLLLASDDVSRRGIGNDSDHVGRYFMDHIHLKASKFVPASSFPVPYNAYASFARNLNFNVGFTDAQIRKLKLLQYYCRFVPCYTSEQVLAAGRRVRDKFMEPGNLAFLQDVATVVSDIGGAAKYTAVTMTSLLREWQAVGRLGVMQPDYFELDHRIEQAPNPDSRVVLSGRRDALGSRIADLDWRLSEPDFRSFREAQRRLALELSALGYGRFELEELTSDAIRSRVRGHYHHIGTTRMSEHPREGVVNSDCRVHGLGNLYVCGSSVFPTAGYSGPTMMIIAMAMRLAEHVRQRYGR